jgi:hypothetical protein
MSLAFELPYYRVQRKAAEQTHSEFRVERDALEEYSMKSTKPLLVKSLLILACAGIVGVAVIPRLRADEWNKRTTVTLNQPIIAGNKVLEPGTYVWKLMDSPSNRNIVRIYNQDGSKLETTILAIPNYRLKASGNTQFEFWETPAGVPKAVRAWFYPGDNFGQEFAYPKKLVAQLASARPTPIPTHYNPPVAESQPQPAAEPAATPAPEPAAQPQPQQMAQNTGPERPAAAQAEPTPAEEPATLPKTASYGPLVGLLGVFSLGLAGVLTLGTKKS